jgi:hypothetical protein
MLVGAFTLNDVQLTVDHDETGDILIACLDKHLAGFEVTAMSVPRDSCDVLAGELRKQLIRPTD